MGRIGDSPIIGAGTYAQNDGAAVSATGTGELFIRQAAAYRVSALMEYAGMRVERAAPASVDEVAEIGGPDSGGLIALDRRGDLAMPFNTSGMYRAYATSDGDIVVRIFADERTPPALRRLSPPQEESSTFPRTTIDSHKQKGLASPANDIPGLAGG